MHASLTSQNALNSILHMLCLLSTVTTVVEKQNIKKTKPSSLYSHELHMTIVLPYRFSLDDWKEGIDGNMLLPSCSQHLVVMERLVGRSFVADG